MITQPTWREYNALARSYMDFLKVRIAQDTRIRLLYEDRLIKEGLMQEIITEKKNEVNGKIKREIKRELIIDDDDEEELNHTVKQRAEAIRQDMIQNYFVYAKLVEMAKKSESYRMTLLKDCQELFENSKLWQWCERTKGLGPVAAMTFLGYIRPITKDRITGNDRPVRVEEVWSYFGLTENSRIVAGQKSSFNLELKGRMFVIARNVIMHADPYYSAIYRLKKDYYTKIDSKLELKNKKKGWLGWIDANAKLTMIKIIMSHATQIIIEGLGLEFKSEHANHRYLPPKPEDPVEVQYYIEKFKSDMPAKIEAANQRYRMQKEEANHHS